MDVTQDNGNMAAAEIFILVVDFLQAHQCLPIELVHTIFDFSGIHTIQNQVVHLGRDFDDTTYLGAEIVQPSPCFDLCGLKVEVWSKDQGWGNLGPFSWMELVVGSRNEYTSRLLTNENDRTTAWSSSSPFVQTIREFKKNDPEFQAVLEHMNNNSGAAHVSLLARSSFPRWRCIVKEARITCRWSPNVTQIKERSQSILQNTTL